MAISDVAGCAAPDQSAPIPASVDLEKETVITGVVRDAENELVGGAYVRLLDATGEFTAEVVTSPQGVFRFFAAPGSWTVRALSRHGNGDLKVDANRGVNQVLVTVAA
jgi:DNA/RNA endonuclease YhcR with UshA esterase domain